VPDVRDVHTYPHSYTIFHSNASGPKGPRPAEAGRHGRKAVRVRGAERLVPYGGPTPKTPKNGEENSRNSQRPLLAENAERPQRRSIIILLERRKQRKMDLAIFQDDPLGLLENSQVAPPTRYRANRKSSFSHIHDVIRHLKRFILIYHQLLRYISI